MMRLKGKLSKVLYFVLGSKSSQYNLAKPYSPQQGTKIRKRSMVHVPASFTFLHCLDEKHKFKILNIEHKTVR